MTILNQQKLADAIPDAELRHWFTRAVEFGAVDALHTYLLNNQLATEVAAARERAYNESREDEAEDEEDES